MLELFPNTDSVKEREEVRFLLKSLTVFNWGPFAGMQPPAQIHPNGSAIIGATGSGKTTLVDALMTLLVARPRYNYASTGGHDTNDRSEISYVRGVKGAMDSDGEGAMRSGKTITGISAIYTDEIITYKLGAVMWLDSNSHAAADLKRIWFIIKNHEDDLTEILKIFDEGGKAAVKKYAKIHHHIETYDSKKSYLAAIRRFFEVGENAFDLLNRAAGLKQLTRIDQIFRELVLDNKPQFDRALKVAKSFDDLETIHQELLLAKKQVESLNPIEAENKKWQTLKSKLETFKLYRETIPQWFAEQSKILLEKKLKSNKKDLEIVAAQYTQNTGKEKHLSEQVKTLQTIYLEQGGGAIEGEKSNIQTQKQLLGLTENALATYHNICEGNQLHEISNQEQFSENILKIKELREGCQQRKEQLQQRQKELGAKNYHLVEKLNKIHDEIRAVQKSEKSNIPHRYQQFRELMAQELDLESDRLPYIAEMLEVKPEHSEWRGAIERAIGPERLRLLVPEDKFNLAKKWVNQRDNQLHVRLLDISKCPPPREPFRDSYIHKINLEEGGGYITALMYTLVNRDRHCADSIDSLGEKEHSMTVEGLMYDRAGKFEKMDQRPLSKDWWTGFDNSYALQDLKDEKITLEQELSLPLKEEKRLTSEVSNIDNQLLDLRQLENTNFESIDVFSIRKQLEESEQKLRQLQDPNSDLAKVHLQHEKAEEELLEVKKTLSEVTQQLGAAKDRIQKNEEELYEAEQSIGSRMTDEIKNNFLKDLKPPTDLKLRTIKQTQSETAKCLNDKLDKCEEDNRNTTNRLKSLMERAKQVDSGALLETGTDLLDIEEYVERLNFLRKEDLPKRQKSFLDYLNQSSEQGVTQLLQKIKNEVLQIQDRLEQLNATLGKVEYKKGKFLMLESSEISSDTLREVKRAEQKIIASRLQSDDTGELRYIALRELVDIIRKAANNKTTLASKSLLDPRHRLEFYVVEVDRETQRRSGKLEGSQSASGGEKEQMASYILTASLSYALCPKGALLPKYATIVLDEAFSKSSPSAASKIIQALREFGLHPLFVTPNKEIGLLKANTSSAILVHQATISSLTWRELEEKRQTEMQRKLSVTQAHNEVTQAT